ncbi:MAG: hypothetical protein ACLSHW_01650 [Lachnospiraceae bacterium]
MEWQDELTLIAETAAENRVNKNGFAVKPEESARTVFCNKKSVGYSEYFKSQQTGKLVEAKYEVHKADYGGEDVVEVNGRRYFVLKTYDTGTDTIELTLTDLRQQKRGVSMGEFNTVGLEDIIDAFSRREAATVEAVPKMLKAGADVLIEAQRAEAQAMGLNETGGFINSIKATDVKGDDTEKYVEIYPQGRAKHGNDRKGDKSKVRYATIGFVAEYGTSSHAARPYMTVANEKAHEKVVEAQRSIWESETGE